MNSSGWMIAVFIFIFCILWGKAAQRRSWAVFFGLSLFIILYFVQPAWPMVSLLLIGYGLFIVFFCVTPVRRNCFSRRVFKRWEQEVEAQPGVFALLLSYQKDFQSYTAYFDALTAVRSKDLPAFDRAFFSFLAQAAASGLSAFFLAWSLGYCSNPPYSAYKRYYQRYDEAAFAFTVMLNTVLVMTLSIEKKQSALSALKRIERYLSFGLMMLRLLEQEGDVHKQAVMEWLAQATLYRVEGEMFSLIMALPRYRVLLKFILFPFGRRQALPLDELGAVIWMWETLLALPDEASVMNPQFSLDPLFQEFEQIVHLQKSLQEAKARSALTGEELVQNTTAAVGMGLINQEQADKLLEVERLKQNWQS